MRTRTLKKGGVVLLAAVLLAAAAGGASSAVVAYNLRVAMDNLVMPDNVVVPVWKIANVADNVFGFPGPTLVGAVGDTLEITLINGLPADNAFIAMEGGGSLVVPGYGISIVIPGLAMPTVDNLAPQPTFFNPVVDNVSLPPRVISYVQVTPPGGTRTYRFTLSKPGTFLYQSGADPSVQVQMGLYGALIVRPAAPGQAYDDPATAFDNEAVLLYSEIDPKLHESVAQGKYGQELDPADPLKMPSSVEYGPKYFLVNGKPYQNQLDPLVQHHTPVPIGAAGVNTLLRFLNAGLAPHAPTFPDTSSLVNGSVSVIGEDGNLLPFPRIHQTVLLPPGKTLDVLLMPTEARNIPMFDRRNFVTNAGTYPGGMITILAPSGADAEGPVTTFDNVAPSPSLGISPVLITATAADAGSNVVAAEWMADNTVREGGGNPMTGAFDNTTVSLQAFVPLSAIPANNTIWIRSEDAEGNWSLPVAASLGAPGATGPVAIVETFFAGGERLVVRAASNAPAGTAVLTVVCDGAPCGGETAPTPLVYRSGINLYEAEIPRLPAKPDFVTVTGGGQSVTAPVPFP